MKLMFIKHVNKTPNFMKTQVKTIFLLLLITRFNHVVQDRSVILIIISKDMRPVYESATK